MDDDDDCLDVVEDDEEVPREALDPPSGRNIPYFFFFLFLLPIELDSNSNSLCLSASRWMNVMQNSNLEPTRPSGLRGGISSETEEPRAGK